MKKYFSSLLFVCAYCMCNAQETIAITHDGIDRSYILYAPSGEGPFPLVLCLHGYTNNADFQMGYSGFNDIAEAENFIVIYPQGEPDDLGIDHWNAWLAQDDVNDVDFISTLIDEAILNHDADPTRVYSCGFSNGGIMSYTLACELNDRIAAVASVAGTMNPEVMASCVLENQTPVMHVHGDLDLVVPINGSLLGDITDFGELISVEETMSFWNDGANCNDGQVSDIENTSFIDLCTATKTVWSCTGGIENWYYEVNGGGHTWPGAFPLIIVGSTNQDFDASEEIWAFFSQYQLDTASNLPQLQHQKSRIPIQFCLLNGQQVQPKEISSKSFYIVLWSDGSRSLELRE